MKKLNVQKMVLTALFVALTAVGALITIPTALVSFTLQLLFVFLAGILLGPAWGALSQLLYLLLGLAGAPIFAGRVGGLSYVLKPSFGFLLAFIAAAAVTGWLTRQKKQRTVLGIVLACLAGLAVTYAIGLPYMAFILNVHPKKGMDAWTILKTGMLMFLPWDGLKIVATVIVSKALLPVLERMEQH